MTKENVGVETTDAFFAASSVAVVPPDVRTALDGIVLEIHGAVIEHGVVADNPIGHRNLWATEVDAHTIIGDVI
mgnify:CR=1 FL=1